VASAISFIFPFLVLGGVLLVAVLMLIGSNRKAQHSKYRSSIGYNRYVSGQFSRQMELDMRLPYRRFKQLYPHSNWNYLEYKRMQTQTAFRRSTSSQQNRRMVR
jgi:hypothetical protein